MLNICWSEDIPPNLTGIFLVKFYTPLFFSSIGKHSLSLQSHIWSKTEILQAAAELQVHNSTSSVQASPHVLGFQKALQRSPLSAQDGEISSSLFSGTIIYRRCSVISGARNWNERGGHFKWINWFVHQLNMYNYYFFMQSISLCYYIFNFSFMPSGCPKPSIIIYINLVCLWEDKWPAGISKCIWMNMSWKILFSLFQKCWHVVFIHDLDFISYECRFYSGVTNR